MNIITGTGHAVLCAKDIVNTPFAVINADDYYGEMSYKVLADYLQNIKPNQYAMVAFELGNTLSNYGSVSRGVCSIDDKNNLIHIQEYIEIVKKDDKIYSKEQEFSTDTPVSLNFWGFTPAIFPWFEKMFIEFLQHGTTSEFQLPQAIDQGILQKQFSITVLQSKGKWLGMTYAQDKEWVQQYLSK